MVKRSFHQASALEVNGPPNLNVLPTPLFTALQIIVYKSFKTLRIISRGQCNRGGGDVFHEDRRKLRVTAKKEYSVNKYSFGRILELTFTNSSVLVIYIYQN